MWIGSSVMKKWRPRASMHDPEFQKIAERLGSRLAMTHWKREGMLRAALVRSLAELEIADMYTEAGQAALAREESGELPGAPASYETETDAHNRSELARALAELADPLAEPPPSTPVESIDPHRRR